jgi:hypothetical protein
MALVRDVLTIAASFGVTMDWYDWKTSHDKSKLVQVTRS